jgi:hypothetical protein
VRRFANVLRKEAKIVLCGEVAITRDLISNARKAIAPLENTNQILSN